MRFECGDEILFVLSKPFRYSVMPDNRSSWAGIVAANLLIGATAWGIFCACLLGVSFQSWDDNGEIFLIGLIEFLPGYLVTLGYGIRTLLFPRWIIRQAIWVASFIVQGTWLMTLGLISLRENGMNIFFLWWASATVASLAAFLIEPAEAPRRVPRQ